MRPRYAVSGRNRAMKEYMNLKTFPNQLLVAMPKQVGTYFGNTVTYLCFHNEYGAFGLMVNRPTTIKLGAFLKQMQCPSLVDSKKILLEGGPVDFDQGFILHSNDVVAKDSQILCENLALTASKDLLQRIGEGSGPEKYLVTLGYAGWSPNQLEQEIADGAWLVCPKNDEIVFHDDFNSKPAQALQGMGIDLNLLSSDFGEA